MNNFDAGSENYTIDVPYMNHLDAGSENNNQ